MGQNQNIPLWSEVKELISKAKTLLAKRIENWTKELDKKIINAESSAKDQAPAKDQTPAKVVDTGESNMANQSGHYYNIEKNDEKSSSPVIINNKTKVYPLKGLGSLIFVGLIVFALFSVPDKTDHVETITKKIPTYEIYEHVPQSVMLQDSKIQAALKGTINENLKYENYYLFSVCHKKERDYDFFEVLEGNFVSFGIFGKVFLSKKMEETIEEKIEERIGSSMQESDIES